MLQWLISVCLLCTVAAYSGGAGNAACNSYTPLHGSNAQSSSSPYQVQVTADQYAASGTLTVTLRGTSSNLIKGFYIGAAGYEDKNSIRHGSFAATGSTLASYVQTKCNDNKALTHTSTFSGLNGVETVTLTWTAPAALVGSIRFFVTFVKQQDTFWVAVPSEIIWDGQGIRPTDPPLGVVTDGPTVTPVIKDGCGVSESCYRICKDDKCEFILKWKTVADNIVNFQLVANSVEAPGYVALGLTSSQLMEDVTVMACAVDASRSVSIQTGFAKSRTSGVELLPSVSTAADEEGSYISDANEITCRFSYNNTLAASIEKYKDLNSEFNVIVARGPFTAGSIGKHDELPKLAPQKISLLKTGAEFQDFTGRRVYGQVKAHGCLMVAAWGFCASIGIIMSRYYKAMWPNKTSCGKKVWFQSHVSCMVSCMMMTLNGIIQIFVFNKAFVLPENYPDRLHPILGMIAFICAFINPIMAIFRCKPEDSKRPIFNWFHRSVGTIGFLCGLVTMVIGLQLDKIVNPSWLYGLGIATVLFHFIMEIILFVHDRMHSNKMSDARPQSSGTKDGRAEFQMEQELEPEGTGFKNMALWVHMAVVGILNAIIIIIMAINGSLGIDL